MAAGARGADELVRVLATAHAQPFCTGRYGRGVLAGLHWALGHPVPAPITAAASPPGEPHRDRLRSEADAALSELLGHDGRTVPLDYARGVYEALAWSCGHREDPPATAGP